MTAQNPRSQKPRSRTVLACGLALGAAFLILLLVAAFFLLRARLTREAVTAWISSPEMDQQVELNQPVNVLAGATDRAGASRVEVYADGALVLAQDSTGQGESQLDLTGSWVPLTTGRHALMARGYGLQDEQADSSVVYVDVLAAPESMLVDVDSVSSTAGAGLTLGALAEYLGTTPDELIRRNPDLGGLGANDPIPPGTRIEAPSPPSSPPEASSPPPPRSGTPAAPTGLGGIADCSMATLTWTASADAQTYRVYRLAPGATRPEQIADGLRTTSYTDRLPAPGVYRYQVAAVRGRREGLSLMYTPSFPAGCTLDAAPPGVASDLVLTVAMVDTDEVWDGIFCYLTINGSADNHIPEGDSSYLAPERSNPKYYNLTRLPNGGRKYLYGQQFSTPVTLGRTCWGRRGPRSESLGTFSVSHPSTEWNGMLRTASGGRFRFSYCLGPSTMVCTPSIPAASYAELLRDLHVELFYLPAPTNVRRIISVEACSDLPDLLDRIACGSSSILCLFGGCEGRQTIFWNWVGTPIFPESSLTGYSVFRTTYDLATGTRLMTISWDVTRRDGTLPRRSLADEGDLRCGQRVEYRVYASQAARHSALSDPISFETRRCSP
jgi:hypothetical protein